MRVSDRIIFLGCNTNAPTGASKHEYHSFSTPLSDPYRTASFNVQIISVLQKSYPCSNLLS